MRRAMKWEMILIRYKRREKENSSIHHIRKYTVGCVQRSHGEGITSWGWKMIYKQKRYK